MNEAEWDEWVARCRNKPVVGRGTPDEHIRSPRLMAKVLIYALMTFLVGAAIGSRLHICP